MAIIGLRIKVFIICTKTPQIHDLLPSAFNCTGIYSTAAKLQSSVSKVFILSNLQSLTYIYIGGLLTDIAEVEDVALVVPWLGLPAWLH